MSKKVDVDDDTRYNIHENECYATTMFPSVVNREEIKEVFSKKKWFCTIMIAVTVIAFIITLVICFVFAFIEISSLKSTSTEISRFNSELASIQKSISLSNQEALALTNSSMIEMRFSQDLSAIKNQTMAIQEALALTNSSIRMIEMRFSQNLSAIESQTMAIQEALALTNSSIRMIEMRFSQNLSAIESQTMTLIQNYTETSCLYKNYPAASCGAILQFVPFSSSGHYWIRSSNGSSVCVYCDMTRSCNNITGGWMRVAELDI